MLLMRVASWFGLLANKFRAAFYLVDDLGNEN